MPNETWRCATGGEDFEDHRPVCGEDAEEAAVAFAERECREDPDCYRLFESGQEVSVRRERTGEVTRFTVYMEPVPHFRAVTRKEP